jgi:hypothetical protein
VQRNAEPVAGEVHRNPNIEVLRAPSAGTIADEKGLRPPLRGQDEMVLPALPRPQPDGTSAQVTAAAATCDNCLAHNVMGWIDSGIYEDVKVNHNNNHAYEAIERQNHHVALISSANNLCYEGSFRYTRDSGNIYNYYNSPVISSGYYRAYSDRWTQASGHNWYDDGTHFSVSGGADVCRQF